MAIWDPCEELRGLGCMHYSRRGSEQYVGTPLLFFEMWCILEVAGWEMDWKTPVTQQLFVSREGRGVVTFMLMTYCLLAACVISHHVCVCVAHVWNGSRWFQVSLSTSRFIGIRNLNAQNPWDVWQSGYLASFPSDDTMLYRHTPVKRQESDVRSFRLKTCRVIMFFFFFTSADHEGMRRSRGGRDHTRSRHWIEISGLLVTAVTQLLCSMGRAKSIY
jgi:hypothetical protein